MTCRKCIYFVECTILTEFRDTIDKMSIREELSKDISSLREVLYAEIAMYCRLYIEE